MQHLALTFGSRWNASFGSGECFAFTLSLVGALLGAVHGGRARQDASVAYATGAARRGRVVRLVCERRPGADLGVGILMITGQ